ncbi:MAG TPA: DinB family protein [Acidimicrobiales bacterium]|nr:DinB family protein [Acidimicrobiales bacterium]
MTGVTHCAECGFAYGALARGELAPELERRGAEVAARLEQDGAALRARPVPNQWSVLEYACHVRDVLLMQRDRVYVALVEDEPSFKPMYRNERVGFDRYNEQDPSNVAAEVVMAARLFANALRGLSAAQWVRPLVYGFPDPSARDVEWVAHHTLHEAVHHGADMDRIQVAQ